MSRGPKRYTELLTVRLTAEQYELLRRVARSESLCVSNLVRHGIVVWLEAKDKESDSGTQN